MSAYQTFETVLNTIKASNLNFHLQQTPFSAVVYIKNSLIKDKLGNQLVPPSLEDNKKLSIKLLELENMVSSMKNKLEDSILDSENAYKTITSLENQLCSTKRTLELEKKSHHELSKKTKVQIETLTLLNETLKKENVESRKLFKKNNEELKNEINKKEKLVTNIIAKNEKLQTKNENLEFEKEELARKVKHHKSTISELETKAVEPSTKSTKTTNTKLIRFSSTASQSEHTQPAAKSTFCSHFGCHFRQPHNPPKSTNSKNTYISPPTNIRILPSSVESFEVFSSLQVIHQCEECENGALYCNYYEMVQYPATGPSGGTYGSPVTVCPNHPHAKITILNNRAEDKRKLRRKNICKLCDKKFLEKTNLTFHMNRAHMPRF